MKLSALRNTHINTSLNYFEENECLSLPKAVRSGQAHGWGSQMAHQRLPVRSPGESHQVKIITGQQDYSTIYEWSGQGSSPAASSLGTGKDQMYSTKT